MKRICVKRIAPLPLALLLAILLSACLADRPPASTPTAPSVTQTPAPTPAEPEAQEIPEGYVEEFEAYAYEGENDVTVGDRHFLLKDAPENVPEELVSNAYRYEITGEFEAYFDMIGESESLLISTGNIEELYEEGFTRELIIHRLYTMTQEEVEKADFQVSFQEELSRDVEKYQLTEYTVVRAEIYMAWSEAALKRGPQLGDGDYDRGFLCGKDAQGSWKLYEVYWLDF